MILFLSFPQICFSIKIKKFLPLRLGILTAHPTCLSAKLMKIAALTLFQGLWGNFPYNVMIPYLAKIPWAGHFPFSVAQQSVTTSKAQSLDQKATSSARVAQREKKANQVLMRSSRWIHEHFPRLAALEPPSSSMSLEMVVFPILPLGKQGHGLGQQHSSRVT